MRENAATKGRRYVVEGRLVVGRVDGDHIEATCRGDGATYTIRVDGARWWCSCPALGRCAHMIALGLVVAVPT